jgi:hypothetical protein
MYTKDRPANEIAPKHGTIYVQSGPPKHFLPGYTLTAEDVQELKTAFKARNAYLQGMYERESRLLTQVENLKKRTENLTKKTEDLTKTIENLKKSRHPVPTDSESRLKQAPKTSGSAA